MSLDPRGTCDSRTSWHWKVQLPARLSLSLRFGTSSARDLFNLSLTAVDLACIERASSSGRCRPQEPHRLKLSKSSNLDSTDRLEPGTSSHAAFSSLRSCRAKRPRISWSKASRRLPSLTHWYLLGGTDPQESLGVLASLSPVPVAYVGPLPFHLTSRTSIHHRKPSCRYSGHNCRRLWWPFGAIWDRKRRWHGQLTRTGSACLKALKFSHGIDPRNIIATFGAYAPIPTALGVLYPNADHRLSARALDSLLAS